MANWTCLTSVKAVAASGFVALFACPAMSGGVEINQSGEFQQFEIDSADSSGLDLLVEQAGAENALGISLSGGLEATIEQVGELGQIAVGGVTQDQIAYLMQGGDSNSMVLELHGSGGYLKAEQLGSRNRLIYESVGDENTSLISQSGQGNSIGLRQSGSNLVAELIQTGSGNSLEVSQSAGSPEVFVEQNGHGGSVKIASD